jgi:FMN-dependent NADH-azoreductase
MTTILHVKSSSNLQQSFSRKVGQTLVNHLKAQDAGIKIIDRDLITTPIPHIGPEFLEALGSNDAAGLALSDKLVDEVFASDVIVIESPMYNFGVPSVLKAWIDHVLRAKKTFAYTENGPEGLVKGKKAILVLASGGIYSEGPAQAMDFQEPYLRAALSFIGITDIEVVRIEGVMLGADSAAAALDNATKIANSLNHSRQSPRRAAANLLAIPARFEHAAYSLGNCRSIQLSYGTMPDEGIYTKSPANKTLISA